MLQKQRLAEPRGRLPPHPPVPARLTPPSVCARQQTVARDQEGRTLGTAIGASEFFKTGTQGEQTPTELVHLNCLVPQAWDLLLQ